MSVHLLSLETFIVPAARLITDQQSAGPVDDGYDPDTKAGEGCDLLSSEGRHFAAENAFCCDCRHANCVPGEHEARNVRGCTGLPLTLGEVRP